MKLLRSILLLGICVFLTTAARAEDEHWVGTTSDQWSMGSNWDTGNVPVGGDSVFITQGIAPVIYDDGDSPALNYLEIDNNQELLLDGFDLNVSYNEIVGNVGQGTFSQNSGTHTLGYGLTLGAQTTLINEDDVIPSVGVGTYNLSGTGVLHAVYNEFIGNNGQGTFNQSGGVNTVTGLGLEIGYDERGVGQYILSDGEVNVTNTEIVGRYGQGTFTQTGGKNTVSGDLRIGTMFNSVGFYYLNDQRDWTDFASLNVQKGFDGTNYFGGNMVVGDAGVGAFSQQFGKVYVENSLSLGAQAYGHGEYGLEHGELFVGVPGANAQELIGDLGIGVFSQMGGNNTVIGDLRIGAQAGGNGIYYLGYAYGLGTLDVSGAMRVGDAGTGMFDQFGGDVVVKGSGGEALTIACQNGSTGTYNMSGGTLKVGTVIRDYLTGAEIAFMPGTIQNNGTFNLGKIPVEVFGVTNLYGGGTDANPVLVRGNVKNYGTVNIKGDYVNTGVGVVKFDGIFENHGTLTSDPAKIEFTNLDVAPEGVVQASVGDQYVIAGSFWNHSTNSAEWDTANAQLIFNGTAQHELFTVAADRGATATGYNKNFNWGDLSLAMNPIYLPKLGVDTTILYVGTISGLDINGNIVNNITGFGKIYYRAEDNLALYQGGDHGVYDFADNGGQLIPVVVTPEPAAFLLYGMGGLPLAARFLRRRRKDAANA